MIGTIEMWTYWPQKWTEKEVGIVDSKVITSGAWKCVPCPLRGWRIRTFLNNIGLRSTDSWESLLIYEEEEGIEEEEKKKEKKLRAIL